jgi:hypothetical protein
MMARNVKFNQDPVAEIAALNEKERAIPSTPPREYKV